MRFRRPRWVDALSAVGRSFLEVVAAELSELQHELSDAGRKALRAVALLALSVVLLGWVLGLLATALIAYLESLPALNLWQATLIVAAALLVLIVVLVSWAVSILRRIRPPGEMIQSRIRGHLEWVENQVEGPSGTSEVEMDDDAER